MLAFCGWLTAMQSLSSLPHSPSFSSSCLSPMYVPFELPRSTISQRPPWYANCACVCDTELSFMSASVLALVRPTLMTWNVATCSWPAHGPSRTVSLRPSAS